MSKVIYQYPNGQYAIGQSSAGNLIVRFVWNPLMVYKFLGVPAEVAAEFQAAESKGKFFNTEIKGKYTARKPYEKPLKTF